MLITLRDPPLIFSACLVLDALATLNTAAAQTKPSPKTTTQQMPATEDNAQANAGDEDIPNDEPEVAAVKLDISHSSPLIKAP